MDTKQINLTCNMVISVPVQVDTTVKQMEEIIDLGVKDFAENYRAKCVSVTRDSNEKITDARIEMVKK